MTSTPFRLFAALCILAIAAGAASAQTIERGIVYTNVAGEEITLDLCRPLEPKNAKAKPVPPRPVVVCIHGGAWVGGQSADHHPHIVRLAREGFVAVSINYRLAPKHPYPAAIDDVKAAIRFVRSKAKDWNIDPERLAVMGESAGGHLALLVGLMNGVGDADDGAKVRAVVNYCGPTDFATWRPLFQGEVALLIGTRKNSTDIMKAFLGAADREAEIVKTASPITYVTKDRAKSLPPILTLHGASDPLVPDQQARLLHKALDAAGARNRLELLEKTSHGWGGEMRERTNRMDVEFLKKWLGK